MTSSHPIRCRCGKLQGEVSHTELGTRAVCYCRDCQAFAHYLGSPQDILDALGGTEVVAVAPRWVSFTAGAEQLVCMSLTERGTLRWYARCCRTAIGNTPRNPRMSHVGLIHACLRAPTGTLDDPFGPVRMRVNRQSAKGRPPATPVAAFAIAMLRYLGLLAWSRVSGKYKQNPFFDAATGRPRVEPYVLSKAEHEKLQRAVQQRAGANA
jgi:Family of unknown function (DUF6151)